MAGGLTVAPIATVRSCWPDRFGIPRQPWLVPSATAVIRLHDEVPAAALEGLAGFSHVWVVFVFHAVEDTRWTVRPPRLGGSKRRGVYATRSPHRPNHLGLSVVALDRVDERELHVSGHDLLDGTPVLDLKPYLPYADAVPDARAGWAEAPIPRRAVTWAPEAAAEVAEDPRLRSLVEETFALDPRPAGRRWDHAAVRIGDRDVHAVLEGEAWRVTSAGPWRGPRGR